MLQSGLEGDAVLGDVLTGGVSGVVCALPAVIDGISCTVLGCADGRIVLLTNTGNVMGSVYTGDVIRCLQCEPSGLVAITGGSSGVVKFWDLS